MMHQIALPLSKTQASGRRRRQIGAKRATPWHALEGPSVTRLLDVDTTQGLTASEVATRRLSYGPNDLQGVGSQRITGMLVLLFFSIVIGFLLTAAILNRMAGDSVEAFSVLVGAIIGTIVGFAYVLKAARALDVMQAATRTIAHVTREGKEIRIKAEELVPGDIVTLTAGDSVPADARLVEAVQLEAQESALTGKCTAIEKGTSQVAEDTPLDQRQSMVYLGTTIGSGRGLAVVVATGVKTEIAKIAACDN